jgi:hypothetical protein
MCYKLETDDLGALMQLLEAKCPSCLVKKKETNEVEVNVDLISGKAFREAERFVLSKLNTA